MVRLAMTEPQPTRRRPIWLTMMTSALLVYAGLTLVETLSVLREPRTDTASTLEEVARASGQVEAVERLRSVGAALAAQHRRAIQIDALVAIGVSLLTLYVVAAILLRDLRRGRWPWRPAGSDSSVSSCGSRSPWVWPDSWRVKVFRCSSSSCSQTACRCRG